jgi:uncharacterized DUF497 family protein
MSGYATANPTYLTADKKMKTFSWNHEKNKQLQQERGISFEEIVFYIEQGGLLDILEHPNQTQYQRQQLYVVVINEYVYIVPFVENDEEIFLKTIFPSRRYTKLYLNLEIKE